MTKEWVYIGEGGFNQTERSLFSNQKLLSNSRYQGPWVKKTPLDPNVLYSHPERAVRMMKEIYPEMPCGVYQSSSWLMPYYKPSNKEIFDSERASALLDIYNRCGRIILDGCGGGNLIKVKNGDIKCVDVDMAMRHFASKSSLALQKDSKEKVFQDYLSTCAFQRPRTVSMIKTLLWLDEKYPWSKDRPPLSFFVMCRLSYARQKGVPLNDALLGLAKKSHEKGPIYVSEWERMCQGLAKAQQALSNNLYETLLLLIKHHVVLYEGLMTSLLERDNPLSYAKEVCALKELERICVALEEKGHHLFNWGAKKQLDTIKKIVDALPKEDSLYEAVYTTGTPLYQAIHPAHHHFHFFKSHPEVSKEKREPSASHAWSLTL